METKAIEPSDWALYVDAAQQGSSDGFWYDLTVGGYINLDKLIEDPAQLAKANDAVNLLCSLKNALETADLLVEF